MAIASLVTSIVSILINPLSILGIIFGAISLTQIKKNPAEKGKGLAVTGIVIGIIILVVWIIIIAAVGASFFFFL